jgi:putative hydrolase of the HAD superfamily
VPAFTAIRTERLIIDRLLADDAAALVVYKSDPTVALHQGWTLPFDRPAAERLIAATFGDAWERGGQLALRLRRGELIGDLIGDLMVSPVQGVPHAVELGITVARPSQGQGLALEAVRGVVDALFQQGHVHRIIAYVAVANERSQRLFERAGFLREGLLRDSYRARDGSLIDEVLFGLTRPSATAARPRYDVIAFDADDTLWHSEDSFFAAEQAFVDLVSPYVETGIDVKAALAATERRDLPVLGYGVKAFGLSMLETAAVLAGERLPVSVIVQLGDLVREMLLQPVRLLPDVAAVLEQVGASHRLVLITKGDLIHQTAKVETSGLAHHFERVEIVMEKDSATYARIINVLGVQPERFCMVGNSVRSDVLPVLALGASAVHVPYPLLWDLEQAPHDHGHVVAELASLAQLPQWLTAGEAAPQ